MTCIFPTFDDLIFHYVYSCLAKGMVAPLPAPLNPTKTSSSLTRKPWRLAFSKLILTLWPLRVLSRCAISFQEPNTVSSRTANAQEFNDRRKRWKLSQSHSNSTYWKMKIKIWRCVYRAFRARGSKQSMPPQPAPSPSLWRQTTWMQSILLMTIWSNPKTVNLKAWTKTVS